MVCTATLAPAAAREYVKGPAEEHTVSAPLVHEAAPVGEALMLGLPVAAVEMLGGALTLGLPVNVEEMLGLTLLLGLPVASGETLGEALLLE